jgi:hypothetical protein
MVASILWIPILLCLSAPGAGADLTADYTWQPMKIGGGGWMTGMDIHPTEKGLMYARTDVSGAYRWQPASSSWKQLVTSDSMPPDYVGYGKYRGVDSIVATPADPDVVWMAYEGEIFRSTNRGDKWTATGFARHGVKMEPNGEGRQEGERLGVDPRNSNIVYYGSIANGLWRTEDAGATWTRLEDIPAGSAPHGVNTITFDNHSVTLATDGIPTKTTVICVTTDQEGIHRSEDGGVTWTNIAGSGSASGSTAGPGTSCRVRDAAIGSDRVYYVACDNAGGATGSVWKYSPDGIWKNITPSGDQGGSQSWWGIAVHPADPQKLVVIRNGGQGFVSGDQGATWEHRSFHLNSPRIQWLDTQENYWLSVGEIAFDPSGTLWFAEGFGIWRTDNFSPERIEWQAASEGIEETCGNDVIAPPGGKPLAAMWDVGAFRFSDPDAWNARRAFPYFMSAWALDWCAADPEFIAGVFRNHLGFPPHVNENAFSTDGGVTWKIFPAFEKKEIPEDSGYGIIAVSANSPDKIVWCPANNKPLLHTRDRGVTWAPSSFGDASPTGFGAHYSPLKSLCADRVLPDTFYLYDFRQGIFRSTDGGATFTKTGGTPPVERYNAIMKSAPGYGGDLWFAEGSQGAPVGGIWRSRDGGKTWRGLPGIEQAFNFGFGKARKDGGYPALYVAGVARGAHEEPGIWRSTDEGVTWDRIGGYPLGIFDWIDAMDGDKDVFGKVYIAFTSTGLVYGKISRPHEEADGIPVR